MAEGLAEHPVAAEVVQLQVIHLAGLQRAAWPHNVGPPTWLRPDALAVEALQREKSGGGVSVSGPPLLLFGLTLQSHGEADAPGGSWRRSGIVPRPAWWTPFCASARAATATEHKAVSGRLVTHARASQAPTHAASASYFDIADLVDARHAVVARRQSSSTVPVAAGSQRREQQAEQQRRTPRAHAWRVRAPARDNKAATGSQPHAGGRQRIHLDEPLTLRRRSATCMSHARTDAPCKCKWL